MVEVPETLSSESPSVAGPSLSPLPDVLGELVPEVNRIRLRAMDVGLDEASIDWSGSPKKVWQQTLQEAKHQGKLDALIEYVARKFPDQRNDLHNHVLDQSPSPLDRHPPTGSGPPTSLLGRPLQAGC